MRLEPAREYAQYDGNGYDDNPCFARCGNVIVPIGCPQWWHPSGLLRGRLTSGRWIFLVCHTSGLSAVSIEPAVWGACFGVSCGPCLNWPVTFRSVITSAKTIHPILQVGSPRPFPCWNQLR